MSRILFKVRQTQARWLTKSSTKRSPVPSINSLSISPFHTNVNNIRPKSNHQRLLIQQQQPRRLYHPNNNNNTININNINNNLQSLSKSLETSSNYLKPNRPVRLSSRNFSDNSSSSKPSSSSSSKTVTETTSEAMEEASDAAAATPTASATIQGAVGFTSTPPSEKQTILAQTRRIKTTITDSSELIMVDNTILQELKDLQNEITKIQLNSIKIKQDVSGGGTKSSSKKSFYDRFMSIFEWPGVLVHCSSMCSIGAMFMTDMLYLRVFVILASSFSTIHWRIRKPVVWSAVFWGLFFGTGHLIMLIRILLDERKIIMSERENEIYTNGLFAQSGFTGVQFKKVYERATLLAYNEGDIIVKQGDKKDNVYYLYKGRINVVDEGVGHKHEPITIATMDSGFIGKLLKNVKKTTTNNNNNNSNNNNNKDGNDGNDNANNSQKSDEIRDGGRGTDRSKHWKYTLVADRDVQVLKWDQNDIDKFLTNNGRLKESAIKVMNADLNKKLDFSQHFQQLVKYEKMLAKILKKKANALGSVISDDEYDRLLQYRNKHNISEEEHIHALEATGWTVREYERGFKVEIPGLKFAKSVMSMIP